MKNHRFGRIALKQFLYMWCVLILAFGSVAQLCLILSEYGVNSALDPLVYLFNVFYAVHTTTNKDLF